jgi:hypothetical protein
VLFRWCLLRLLHFPLAWVLTADVQVLPSVCTCSVGILLACIQLLSSILCERYSGDYDPSDDGELPTGTISKDDSDSRSTLRVPAPEPRRVPVAASINQRAGGTGSLPVSRGSFASESRPHAQAVGDVVWRQGLQVELSVTSLPTAGAATVTDLTLADPLAVAPA